MKSLHRTALGGVIAASATMASCALVGYDFSDYKSSGSGGSGGSDTSASQTTGPGSTTASGTSGSGGPSSGSAATGGSSSSGTGGSQPCLGDADCEDGNLCTTDVCSSGLCGFPPVTLSDNNPCTTDGCNPSTGMAMHTPIADCCPHSVCLPGLPLDPGACVFMGAPIDCVAEICGTTPSCCTSIWDATCITNAKNICENATILDCMCAHSYCVTGAPLDPKCDPCVQAVCTAQTSCCTVTWGDDCVTATHTRCNIPLGADCQ